jgi:hypothetical protein
MILDGNHKAGILSLEFFEDPDLFFDIFDEFDPFFGTFDEADLFFDIFDEVALFFDLWFWSKVRDVRWGFCLIT